MEMLRLKLNGYYRYYCITDNSIMPRMFMEEVRKMMRGVLWKRAIRRKFSSARERNAPGIF